MLYPGPQKPPREIEEALDRCGVCRQPGHEEACAAAFSPARREVASAGSPAS
jgi:hypothetical protein